MSRSMSRTLIAAIATVGFAAAVPGTAFATGDAGMWKVNPEKSHMALDGASQSGTLTIDRATSASDNGADGKVAVVNNGNVYLTDAATAKKLLAGKRVSADKMTRIGTNVRSTDICGFLCQSGQPDQRLHLKFTATGGQEANSVLAQNKK